MYFFIGIVGDFLLFFLILCDIAEDIVYYIVSETVKIIRKIYEN